MHASFHLLESMSGLFKWLSVQKICLEDIEGEREKFTSLMSFERADLLMSYFIYSPMPTISSIRLTKMTKPLQWVLSSLHQEHLINVPYKWIRHFLALKLIKEDNIPMRNTEIRNKNQYRIMSEANKGKINLREMKANHFICV